MAVTWRLHGGYIIFVPSHVVVFEGSPSRNLFFIHRGVVNVWQNFDEPKRRQLLSVLTNNDFFGEAAVLASSDDATTHLASATCECASYCEMLILTQKMIRSVWHRASTHEMLKSTVRAGAQLRKARTCAAGLGSCNHKKHASSHELGAEGSFRRRLFSRRRPAATAGGLETPQCRVTVVSPA